MAMIITNYAHLYGPFSNWIGKNAISKSAFNEAFLKRQSIGIYVRKIDGVLRIDRERQSIMGSNNFNRSGATEVTKKSLCKFHAPVVGLIKITSSKEGRPPFDRLFFDNGSLKRLITGQSMTKENEVIATSTCPLKIVVMPNNMREAALRTQSVAAQGGQVFLVLLYEFWNIKKCQFHGTFW